MILEKLKEKYGHKKIALFASDQTGCGKMRIEHPHRFLKDTFTWCEYNLGFPVNDGRTFEADIIWLQRPNHEYFTTYIPDIQEQGKKVIIDLDDTLHHIPSGNLAHRHYPKKELDKVDAVFKLADCLTTSTVPLQQELESRYNKKTFILPNHLFKDEIFIEGEKPKNEKIKVAWAGSYCYDEETEILTENGWKFFKDLNKTEKVASLNTSTNELEYHLPTEYVNTQYDGIMYVGKNRDVDFCVTPNHNMYISPIKNISNKQLDYKFTSIENLENIDFHVKKDCIYENKDVEYFVLPSITVTSDRISTKNKEYQIVTEYPEQKIDMDDWLILFGFFVTEGWCSTLGKTGMLRQVGFAQHKDNDYLQVIEKIIKKYGWNYSYAKNHTNLRIFNRQLWEYLSQFGKALSKYIPQELLSVSKRQLKILFDWMIKGDGSISDNRISFCSSSKLLIDNMSEIVLKLGMVSSISNRGRRISYYKGKKIIPRSDNYIMKVSYKICDRVVCNSCITKINYTGKIYCVTVPHHTLYVRRNGKSMWCGNTHLPDFDNHLVKVLRGLPKDKCDFYCMGYTPTFMKDFAITLPWVETTKFHEEFKNQNPDISIMVASDNKFNECKSNLKYLEGSAVKSVSIGHSVYPYTTTIEHGVDGFLVNNTKTDWKEYIYRLIEDEQYRLQVAENAYQKVLKNYTYEEDWEALEQTYLNIFDYLGVK